MRRLALALFVLTSLHPAGALAQAALNKCIDAQGKVTYSNLPCRNARESRRVEIDPAPTPDPVKVAPVQVEPTKASAPKTTASPKETATLRLETQHTTGKPVVRVSARQCDTLTDKLGRVFDKMDKARRNGYSQTQMNAWNEEVKDLERKKQQSGCF